MKTASGVSAAAAAAGAAGSSAAAQDAPALQEGGNESGGNQSGGGNESGAGNESGGGNQSGGGGATHEVAVGAGGENVFEPAELTIAPGDTVNFVWEGDNHNIAPQDIPGEAEWEGHPEIANTGTEYSHTFEVAGTYNYLCEPHAAAGMEGVITAEEGGGGGGGGSAAEEFDPLHIGVPMQKHYIGAATFLAIFATIGFTFYLLKYGESANTSYPNKKD